MTCIFYLLCKWVLRLDADEFLYQQHKSYKLLHAYMLYMVNEGALPVKVSVQK